MKEIFYTFIFSLLSIVFLSACNSSNTSSMEKNAQSNIRIPLKEGVNNNPAIEIDSMIIELENLYINPDPSDGHSPSLILKVNIIDRLENNRVLFQYYERNDSQYQNSFPKAIGKYLFDLEIHDNDIYFLIDTLKFGDEFFIDLKEGRSIIIEDLTVTGGTSWNADLIEPDHSYGGHEIVYTFKVSDGLSDEILGFTYLDRKGEIEIERRHEWKNYRIEILNDFYEPLKMKVLKKEK